MTGSVAIVGQAELVSPTGVPRNLEDMIFAAATGALTASGIERDEVDGIVISASDQTDGRAISSMLTAGPAGAYLNEEINVASSPGHALALAFALIAAGLHKRILLSTWGSASEAAVAGGPLAAEHLSADPYFERGAALSSLAAVGMQALRQRERTDGEAGARAVVVKNRANGAVNERAVVREPLTEEQVLEAAPAAHPLRAPEVAPTCDGAFSFVLADADVAGADPPAWVQGVAWRCDAGRLAGRDVVALPHLRQAALDAYAAAGVADPRRQLDVAEVHDYSADAELLACEALGLCEAGEAPAIAAGGGWARDAELPVNPSGGSLAGEAPFGGPLRKLGEAVRQVEGSAGTVQAAAVERALVQISTGFAGQLQTVAVIGKEPR